MFIDGYLDTSFDSPYFAIPAILKFPAPVKKLIAEYETAWNIYNDTQIKLEEAIVGIGEAEAADTFLLVKAVTAGEPHPGHPNSAQAADTKAYLIIATRQTARAADKLAEQIRASLTEHRTDLLEQAIPLERALHAEVLDAHAEAREIIDSADLMTREIGVVLNFVTDNIDGPSIHTNGTFGITAPQVIWPAAYEFGAQIIENHLVHLEASITDPTGALAAAANKELTRERKKFANPYRRAS